ncbi:STAS domain-containing protein [Catellatospora coxensis]|uniref:STAS domain-containing protein n=1 Tax=Catellatospora coxensis TaxID=310354 RepID=A0A8J3P6S6_9ACTN|nr:STAS domain-containing protein [Catellatospora coxensis]GIG03791.1 hypothetical protein Cco03nite_04910 [Catellatospora coxensis]
MSPIAAHASVHVANLRGRCLVSICGEIDMCCAGAVQASLRRTVQGRALSGLVVDLAMLTFIDARGLAALLDAAAHARVRQLCFAVINAGPVLHDAVTSAAGANAIETDCQALSFCDSSGVAALIKARRLALQHGKILRLVNVDGLVRDVLQVCGVLDHLTGHDRQAEGSSPA